MEDVCISIKEREGLINLRNIGVVELSCTITLCLDDEEFSTRQIIL